MNFFTKNPNLRQGFTLIELSIVLVIIGLIVGGVLVGRNLISAAAVRAQISQIEKYQQAVNTFKGKYGALPGDIADPAASSFGFLGRTPILNGNVDGLVQGDLVGAYRCDSVGWGETELFWRDLSDANLIEGNFPLANGFSTSLTLSQTQAALLLPTAKIGQGDVVYVYCSFSTNYFGVSYLNATSLTTAPTLALPFTGFTVAQARSIDSKIDDGMPGTGNVISAATVRGSNNLFYWSGYDPVYQTATNNDLSTLSTVGTAQTCSDNSGGSGPHSYSITQNNGSGLNCTLSFKFQ